MCIEWVNIVYQDDSCTHNSRMVNGIRDDRDWDLKKLLKETWSGGILTTANCSPRPGTSQPGEPSFDHKIFYQTVIVVPTDCKWWWWWWLPNIETFKVSSCKRQWCAKPSSYKEDSVLEFCQYHLYIIQVKYLLGPDLVQWCSMHG